MKYGALGITFVFGFIFTFGCLVALTHMFHTGADDIENQFFISNGSKNTGNFTLPIRNFWHAYSFNESEFMTEFDSTVVLTNKTFNKSDVAIIIIDVWDYNTTYNKGFYYRSFNTTENITRLVDFARKEGIPVIHSYNLYNTYITPIEGEFVVNATDEKEDSLELSEFLHRSYITTLFYTGYATNMCILYNPTGIIKMHDRGFNTIIMRDGTKALEANSTIENEFAKKVSIRMIETQFEGSCTIVDFMKYYVS
jgi:nicotinamidase-related amidase